MVEQVLKKKNKRKRITKSTSQQDCSERTEKFKQDTETRQPEKKEKITSRDLKLQNLNSIGSGIMILKNEQKVTGTEASIDIYQQDWQRLLLVLRNNAGYRIHEFL